jgi:hypothetical protein
LGGVSGESGLVSLSCGLWNDRENDHLSKQLVFPMLAWERTGKTARGRPRCPPERVNSIGAVVMC